MHHANPTVAAQAADGISQPVAGVIGGCVAGAAYLLAQIASSAALRPAGAAEPLQRIAAILMGPDSAPPAGELTFTVVGMALIIHFGLSMSLGRVVSTLVWPRRMGTGILVGALVGLALYALNFGLIAPAAFPWFADSLRWWTMVDHALFGAVAAAVCLALRSRRS
jgi:hypothetical protein